MHIPKNFRSGTVTLRAGGWPGGVGACTLVVPLQKKDFKIAGLMKNQKKVVFYEHGGDNSGAREGKRVNPTGGFTTGFSGFQSADRDRLMDFLLARRQYLGRQRSPNGPPGDADLIDIVFRLIGDEGQPNEFFELRGSSLEADYAQGDDDNVSVKYECGGDVVFDDDTLVTP
jgi:hypothetical protein